MNEIFDNFTMGNNSEYSNVLTSNSPRLGQTCAQFNGSQYVRVPRNAMIESSFTFNIWVYKDNWTVTTRQDIIASQQSGGWGLFISSNTNNLRFEVYSSVSNSYEYCTTPIESSGWHMITGIFNSNTKQIFLYVDGVLKSSNNFTANKITYHASNRMLLGAQVGSGGTPDGSSSWYFSGKLDDFKIYATAFNQEDINNLYHNRATLDNDNKLKIKWIDEAKYNLESIDLNAAKSSLVQVTKKDNEWTITSNGGAGLKYVYLRPSSGLKLNTDYVCSMDVMIHSVNEIIKIIREGTVTYKSYSSNLTLSGIKLTSNVKDKWIKIWFIYNTGSNADGQKIMFYPDDGTDLANFAAGDYIKASNIEIYEGSTYVPKNNLVDEMGVCKPENNICEMGRRLRYIRLSMDGSNENAGNHLNKLSYTTINETTTILCDRGKSISMLNGSVVSGGITPNTQSPQETGWWDVTIPTVFDIGKEEIVAYINMVRYYPDRRHYYKTKLEGSIDNANWFTIWDSGNIGSYGNDNTHNTYIETESGRNFIMDCEKAQIVDSGVIIANEFIEE